VCVSHFLTNVEHTHTYKVPTTSNQMTSALLRANHQRSVHTECTPYANRTRVLVHEKPATRGTWAPHGVDGWYIGPSMLHYRCYRIWIPETLSVRVADTLAWFPAQVKMPALSSTDAATAAARDLIHALQHPTGPSPLAPLHDGDTAALKLLADIIATATRAKPSESSNSGPKSAHSDVASA
jgi:hypothetical protein